MCRQQYIFHLGFVDRKDWNDGITIRGTDINNLRFADDTDLLEQCSDKLQEAVQLVSEQGKRSGLNISKAKTQTIVFGKGYIDQHVKVDGSAIENVTSFTYLVSVFTYDNNCCKIYR